MPGIAAVDVRLSKAVLRAPFDGRVGARLLDDGAVAGPGAAVVTLLENGLPRFRVAIDPDLAAETRPGTEVRILADGRAFDAVLSELAPELDAATRGRLAYFDLGRGPSLRRRGRRARCNCSNGRLGVAHGFRSPRCGRGRAAPGPS
jgi:hypothetical protein